MEFVDILVPIRVPQDDVGFLNRLRLSLASVAACRNCRLLVADCSDVPMTSFIVDSIPKGTPFSYAWAPHVEGGYNRSWNINFGFKTLVRSRFFLVSDADMLWRPDWLKTLGLPGEELCTVVPRWKLQVDLPEDVDTTDRKALMELPSKSMRMSGCFLISSEGFRAVRGYDEAFTGWGAEDDSFLDRWVMVEGNRVLKPLLKSPLTAIHLYHPEHNKLDEEATQRNKDRRMMLYNETKAGTFKAEDINPHGWGGACPS